jgi:hypothetical protein
VLITVHIIQKENKIKNIIKMINKYFIIVLVIFSLKSQCQSIQIDELTKRDIYNDDYNDKIPLISARIKCEYKNIDGESLVLNCTLISSGTLSTLNTMPLGMNRKNLATSGSMSTDSIITVGTGNSQPIGISQSGASQGRPLVGTINGNNLNVGQSHHGVTLRIGLEKHWRTPWEPLTVNHNIIRKLYWRSSRISELGRFAFKDLNYLQSLDLSYNRLYYLASETFQEFKMNLLELDLSGNLFQHVPVEVFYNKRLQKIESLKMNDNPINHLNRQPFDYISSSLKSVEFNNCQIRTIELTTFDGMKQLESVSLIGNYLKTLNEQTFSNLILRSFYVHDNPLVCDCHMRWLIDFIKNVDFQQQAYEAQVISSTPFTGDNDDDDDDDDDDDATSDNPSQNMNRFWQRQKLINSQKEKEETLSVAEAAQKLLRCDQPNSLKSTVS